MSTEFSESGAPIYRRKPREEAWTPPNLEDSNLEEITKHIEEHIGPIDMVYHEIVSDLVHVDIHRIAPTDARPF